MGDYMALAKGIHDKVKRMETNGKLDGQTLEARVAALEKVVAYLYVRSNPWKHDD